MKPNTILEVGAENGEFVNHYLEADDSIRFILLEPQELKVDSERVTIIQDGFDAALSQNIKVDAVIAWELIEHIIEPDTFLKTLSSVLNRGAPFIFSTLMSVVLRLVSYRKILLTSCLTMSVSTIQNQSKSYLRGMGLNWFL